MVVLLRLGSGGKSKKHPAPLLMKNNEREDAMKIFTMRISGFLAFLLVSVVPIFLSAVLSLSILASSTLSGLATNFLSKVGIETTESVLTKKNLHLTRSNDQLNKKLNQGEVAAKTARNNVIKRAKKNAIRNIASMPAEAIPVIGVGTIAVVTALELDDMCAIMEFVDDLTKDMSLDDHDASEVQTYCREWRVQLKQASQILKSTETSMRKGWESSQTTIGGTIYDACTSFKLCEDVGLPTQAPPSSQTPTKVSPSLQEEIIKQTTEYIEIVADYWGW